ncbi:hypothetical protein CEXT_793811 [Caerostris extrusa]|uniref:Uncharacterized protein n=1 Tax=Caerostris extrusa TaxID=172846 RepID=A0AAV4QF28_CAEEX|nr:hypothetical protein CEXT_793811 [Caerostris extrusa]
MKIHVWMIFVSFILIFLIPHSLAQYYNGRRNNRQHQPPVVPDPNAMCGGGMASVDSPKDSAVCSAATAPRNQVQGAATVTATTEGTKDVEKQYRKGNHTTVSRKKYQNENEDSCLDDLCQFYPDLRDSPLPGAKLQRRTTQQSTAVTCHPKTPTTCAEGERPVQPAPKILRYIRVRMHAKTQVQGAATVTVTTEGLKKKAKAGGSFQPAVKPTTVTDRERPRNQGQTDKVIVQHGIPVRFCNMFGCDCTPPKRARCCDGYSYDTNSNRCRQIIS